MGVRGIHGDVLGEPAIGFAAQVPHRRRVLVFGSGQGRADDHPAAHQFSAFARTCLDDGAGDIATPDAREINRT